MPSDEPLKDNTLERLVGLRRFVDNRPVGEGEGEEEGGRDLAATPTLPADPPPTLRPMAQDATRVENLPEAPPVPKPEEKDPRLERLRSYLDSVPEVEPEPMPEIEPSVDLVGEGRVLTNETGEPDSYISPHRYKGGRVYHQLEDLPEIIPEGMTIDEYEESVVNKTDFPEEVKEPTRDLSTLTRETRRRVRTLLARAEVEGIDLVVVEARRPQERQEWLFQQGRGRPGNIVTWTLTSNHRQGNAVDFLVNRDWSGTDPGYRWLWKNAKDLGLSFIGPADPGHIAFEDD